MELMLIYLGVSLLTFLDVKSRGELLIGWSESSIFDGDDDPGGEGDGEHLDVSDLWMLLLFLNSCSFGCCCCLLFMFRKTRSEVCWVGLRGGGELVDSRFIGLLCDLDLFIGEVGRNLDSSCFIKNDDYVHRIFVKKTNLFYNFSILIIKISQLTCLVSSLSSSLKYLLRSFFLNDGFSSSCIFSSKSLFSELLPSLSSFLFIVLLTCFLEDFSLTIILPESSE